MTRLSLFIFGLGLLGVGVLVGKEWDRLELPETVATVIKTNSNSRKAAADAIPKSVANTTTTTDTTDTTTTPEQCDYLTRQIIQRGLPDGRAISLQTRCPIPDAWLSDYLEGYEGEDAFIFLNFGCNKGYDALKVAHDVSRDYQTFDKIAWHNSLGISHQGACLQAKVDTSETARQEQLDLIAKSKDLPKRPVQVHCVEAMPGTFSKLQHAAAETGVEAHGMLLHNYAILGNPKEGEDPPKHILFPNPKDRIGREAFSMADCALAKFRPECAEVPAITMDDFVTKHVDANGSDDNNQHRRIPFVTIDTEGFDFTLMKAGPNTLQRTDYLEFEFHDKNDWAQQSLRDATTMLEGLGMTCYWSGANQLWRITQCWTPVYGSFHGWSNVVCVNGQYQPKLQAKMEEVFYATLEKTFEIALKAIPGLHSYPTPAAAKAPPKRPAPAAAAPRPAVPRAAAQVAAPRPAPMIRAGAQPAVHTETNGR